MLSPLFDLISTPLKQGVHLIEASAGTGKTYTIEGIYLRLLLEKKLQPSQILVVTFTEAATSELKERILKKIHSALQGFKQGFSDDVLIQSLIEKYTDIQKNVARLHHALYSFDECAIFTIHGFCQRMLSDFAFDSSFILNSTLIKNQYSLIEEMSQDFWRQYLYTESKEITAFLLQVYKTPSKLSEDLLKVISYPNIQLYTGLENVDFNYWKKKITITYQKLKQEWESSSEEIKQILLQEKALYRSSYKKDSILNWFVSLNLFFKEGVVWIHTVEPILKYFCQSFLNTKVKKNYLPPSHTLFERFDTFYFEYQNLHLSFKYTCLEKAHLFLKSKKNQMRVYSFDDLLLHLLEAISGNYGTQLVNKIRDRYQVALIDEFQDTDPVQYQIFHKIFASQDPFLFFIGDPKQAIYSFRGADIFTYLNAKKETNYLYTLDTNYRSDSNLIMAINAIFSFQKKPFLYEKIQFQKVHTPAINSKQICLPNVNSQIPFHIWFLDEEKPIELSIAKNKIVHAVTTEIVTLLQPNNTKKETTLVPQDIAILVRTHKEAQMFQAALKDKNVPSVLQTKMDIFDSNEFEEMKTILYGILYYSKEERVKAALITNHFGKNQDDILTLTNNYEEWENILEFFYQCHGLWRQKGVYYMFRFLLQTKQVKKRLLEQESGERKLTNTLHILELLHQVETQYHFDALHLIKWMERATFSDEVIDEKLVRLETDDDAVQILTIHRSKGLEFPIVFCPFGFQFGKISGLFFHHPQKNYELMWDIGSFKKEEHKEYVKQEQLAESIRLVYVALTRAKYRCYMIWGKFSRLNKSPYYHLLHPNISDIKQRNLWEDLKKLEDFSKNTIAVSKLPNATLTKYKPNKDKPYNKTLEALQIPYFSRTFSDVFKISSFSSMRSSQKKVMQNNLSYSNIYLNKQSKTISPEIETTDIFHLPSGANTGICIHEILEKIDFQNPFTDEFENQMQSILIKYSIDLKWYEVIKTMILNVLHIPLSIDTSSTRNITLAQIFPQAQIREMEFYFPLSYVSYQTLENFLQTSNFEAEQIYLKDSLQALNGIPQGFLHGYIDLIFEVENKYFIVDWKTNFLGSQIQNYSMDNLTQCVQQHNYVLQYYLYTIALQKYLHLRISDYSFKNNFGGIFYLFLRGINNPISKSTTGIYYDSMQHSEQILNKLTSLLI